MACLENCKLGISDTTWLEIAVGERIQQEIGRGEFTK